MLKACSNHAAVMKMHTRESTAAGGLVYSAVVAHIPCAKGCYECRDSTFQAFPVGALHADQPGSTVEPEGAE